ncbi:MAG: GtrA family protein [Pseudomonadota bacterium]
MPNIETLKRLLRFALVGGAATLMYGGLSLIFLYGLGTAAMAAHLLAYLLVIPLSFLGQKRITFEFKGDRGRAFFRFVLTSLLALLLSTSLVWAVRTAGLVPLYGILGTMLVVPLISYLMMAFWVFLERTEV